MRHRILVYGGLGNLALHRIIPALNSLSNELSLEFATVDLKTSAPGKYYKFGEEPLDEYNVAIIATPNNTHHLIAIKALNSGLHILCEKPLAHSLEAAGEILRVAKSHPAQVSMLSEHYIYKPVIREVIRNQDSYESQIGKMTSIKARILESAGVERREWLLDKDKSGGGIAMDTGAHLVSIMGKLFGYEEINVGKAVITSYKGAPGNSETYAYILLSIKDIPVEIEVGKRMVSTRKDIIFTGNKGELKIDIEKREIKLNGNIEASFPEDDSYPTILKELLRNIENNKISWKTFEDGYKTIKIIKSVYGIAKRGEDTWTMS